MVFIFIVFLVQNQKPIQIKSSNTNILLQRLRMIVKKKTFWAIEESDMTLPKLPQTQKL